MGPGCGPSELNTVRDRSGDKISSDFARHNGDHSYRTARAVHDFERGCDHNRPGDWQLIQIGQASQAELAAAMHDVVIWERRIEFCSLAGIRADRLNPNSEHVPFL